MVRPTLKRMWSVRNRFKSGLVFGLLPVIFVFWMLTLFMLSKEKNFQELELRIVEQSAEMVTKLHRTARNQTRSTPDLCKTGIQMMDGIPKDIFQHVEGSDIYIYSAYQDRRVTNRHQIRIIGIAPIATGTVYCELFYDNGDVMNVTAENILTSVDLDLHRNFKYKPHLFYCDEKTGSDVIAVSLTTKPCAEPSNMILVTPIRIKKESDVNDSIAVCLRTIHHIHSPYIVIEFIEMHRFLGAKHFFIYGAEDISQPLHRVLEYYVTIDLVTIYPWHLPIKNSPVFEIPADIAIHGQHALNNDCLYRTMNNYKVVLMHDMDEYIIPRDKTVHSTWGLIKQVLSIKQITMGLEYSSFYFQNCYFCLDPDDYSDSGPQLLTLKRNIRHICLKPEMDLAWRQNPNQRHIEGGRRAAKKSIIYPFRVIQMGVHGVVTSLPGYEKELKVPTYYAIMHHYKRPQDIECGIKDDMLINKYKKPLRRLVNNVCREIGLDIVS